MTAGAVFRVWVSTMLRRMSVLETASSAGGGWAAAEWLSFWQLVVTIVGLALAGVQLTRTANATVESKNLLARRLLSNDLLVMLPELHVLEDELGAAVKSSDHDQVERALISLTRRSGTIIGHLSANDSTKDEKLVKQIRQTMNAARTAKSEVAGGATRPLPDVVKLTSEKLATVCGEASELIARLQKETA